MIIIKTLQSLQSSIDGVISFLEKMNYAESTIKNQQNIFNSLLKFMETNEIENFNKEIGMKFIRFRTGTDMKGFYGTGDNKTNHYMKPIQNLLEFIEEGKVTFQMRSKISDFKCPTDFEEEYNLYQDECKERNYAKATIISHNRILHKFLYFLNKNNITSSEEITFSHLTEFLSKYEKAKPKYLATIISNLRSYLLFLYHNRFIYQDIAIYLPKVRVMRNAFIPYSWKTEDVKKLLKAVDRGASKGKRDYAILLLIVHLGLRVSDIRALKLSNLNWNRKTINLNMKKSKQPLELPLLEDIGWAIIDYLKNGRPETRSDRIFIRHRAPYDAFGENESFYRELHRYMIKAGLEIPLDVHCGMHSLRSTLARNMLEAKTPLPVISEVLGHQNINTTSIYLKIDLNGLRKCALDPDEVFEQ